jgi:hypothetical protein
MALPLPVEDAEGDVARQLGQELHLLVGEELRFPGE